MNNLADPEGHGARRVSVLRFGDGEGDRERVPRQRDGRAPHHRHPLHARQRPAPGPRGRVYPQIRRSEGLKRNT